MATTSLSRTNGTATDKNKFTLSMWVKACAVEAKYFAVVYNDDNNRALFQFGGNNDITFNSKYSGSNNAALVTNRLCRDPSGWYHFVLNGDSTESVAADRVKLFVNGVQETSFASSTYPSLNDDFYWGEAQDFYIGQKGDDSDYFNGLMSFVYFIDGTAYPASTFGQTDADTGEWTLNTSPTVTYGTNGFSIMQNGNTITDQGDNSNDFTLDSGTLTNTEDCPSDVFATWNPLAANPSNTPTFANGNTSVIGVDTSAQSVSSTLAMPSKGKYYCEMKLTQEANATSSIPNFGIVDAASLFLVRNQELNVYSGAVNSYVGVVNSTTLYADGSSSGTTLNDTPDVGDVIGLAVDLDTAQNTLKYYINGVLAATENINNDEYVFACSIKDDEEAGQVDVNFGNGYFGTTAISSAGTNASDIGIFEFDVPTGYTALSLTGINSF